MIFIIGGERVLLYGKNKEGVFLTLYLEYGRFRPDSK